MFTSRIQPILTLHVSQVDEVAVAPRVWLQCFQRHRREVMRGTRMTPRKEGNERPHDGTCTDLRAALLDTANVSG
jgi:hypothetical protein